MVSDRGVAIITGEPTPAAFELDRDNVQLTVPMGAARLLIDIYAINFLAMYFADHCNCRPPTLILDSPPAVV
jgi:hypothetical protein